MKNLLATVLLTLVYLSSYSQSTFTAATNNNWNNANNWSPSGIPTSSTDVIIPSSRTCTIPSGYAAQCLSLTISGGTLTSVNTSSLTVTNNFDISSGNYNNQTLLNVSASSLTMSGGTMALGVTSSTNAVAFPTISGIVTLSGGTVAYNANTSQSIANYNYFNLTTGGSGNKSLSSNILVNSNLTLNNSATINCTSFDLSVIGNISGAGALSFSSGNLTISGNNTHSGTFTSGTGTVTYDANAGTQTVAGKNYFNLTFTNAGTRSLSGTIGISNVYTPSGTITSGSSTVSFNGGSQVIPVSTYNNVIIAGSSDKTLAGNVTIGGALTITTVTLNADANNISLTGALSGTGNLVFSSGNLDIRGSYTNTGALTTGTGTVTYTGTSGTQTVKSTTYNILAKSGSGTASIGGSVIVTGDLQISAGTFAVNSNTLTVSGNITGSAGTLSSTSGTIFLAGNYTHSGSFTMGTGTFEYNGTSGSQTVAAKNYYNLIFSGASTKSLSGTIGVANTYSPSGSITYGTSTLAFNGASQSFPAEPYYNLTLSGSGNKTPLADLSIINNLAITTIGLDAGAINVSVGLNISGTGSLIFTTGNLDVGGNFTNSGSFTAGTGTVTYNGISGSQTVAGKSYYNLTFTNAATRSLTGTINISNVLTSSGTVSVGSSTVNFNGGTQNIPAFTFSNLTISGSGNKTLTGDVVVNRILTFTSNSIITSSNSIRVLSTGSISGASSTSHVIGNLRMNFSSSSNSKTFPIGDGSNLLNVTITGNSVSGSGYLQLSTTTVSEPVATSYPNISSSNFTDFTKLINRYWTIRNSSLTFSSLDITTSFLNPTDLGSGNSNTNNLTAKGYSSATSSWVVLSTLSRTSTSVSTSKVRIPTNGNSFDFWLGEGSPSKCISNVASGNWTNASSWTGCASGFPTDIDTVVISSGNTITMDGNSGTAYQLLINGTARWTSTNSTIVGAGGVQISSTGDISGNTAGILTIGGNLTIDRSNLTSTTVVLEFDNGSSQQLTSSLSLPSYTIPELRLNANVTNTLTSLTISNAFTGSSGFTLTQPASSTLTLRLTSSGTSVPTIDASANGATVIYDRNGNQVLSPGTYYNLQLTNSGGTSKTTTLTSGINVTNSLSVTVGSATSHTLSITSLTNILNGNNTASFSLGGGSTLSLGSNSSAVAVVFPSTFASYSFNSNSTVGYNANANQTISTTPSYGNLTISGTGTKTISGSSTLFIAGSLTNNGTIDATTNSTTVEFNGTFGSQSITGTNTFYNLNKSGAASINTISNMQTVNNLMTIASGSGQINSNGNITIIEGASIIDDNSSSSFTTGSAGYVVVQKTATGSNRSYFLSSPISSSTATDLMAGQTAQVLGFDTDGTPLDINTTYKNTCAPALRQKGSFNGLYKSETGALTVGRGYSVKQTTSKSISFLGNVNNGDIGFPTLATLNRTIPDGSGYAWCSGPTGLAILGNPYPSSIDWNLVYANSSGLNSSAKIWNGVNYTDVSSSDPVLANRAIKSGQGFMIQVLTTNIPGGSLTFKNSQRIGTNNGTLLRTESDPKTIKVQLTNKTNAEYNDVLNIRFNEEATDRYDEKYDSYDIKGIESVPSIVAVVDGNVLSTTELPLPSKTKILPLSLAITETSSYEIAATTESNIPDDMEVYLVDKTSKKQYDLSKPNLIKLESGEYDNYEIQLRKFDDNNGTLNTKDYNKVYVSENKVKVEYTKDYTSDLIICDITGKVLFTKNNIVNGTYEFELGNKNSSQFYIVKIMNPNETNTYKIIVQ